MEARRDKQGKVVESNWDIKAAAAAGYARVGFKALATAAALAASEQPCHSRVLLAVSDCEGVWLGVTEQLMPVPCAYRVQTVLFKEPPLGHEYVRVAFLVHTPWSSYVMQPEKLHDEDERQAGEAAEEIRAADVRWQSVAADAMQRGFTMASSRVE